MFDKRWISENDFTKQEVMSLRTQTARKFCPRKQNDTHIKVVPGINWAQWLREHSNNETPQLHSSAENGSILSFQMF